MASDRIRKINELIREEAGRAINETVSRDYFVTVTNIETSRDLKNTTIWVSIMNDEKKAFEALIEKKSAIQHAITSKMATKYTPKIEFKIDHSLDHAMKIEELLKND
jgi:ribosome-binding factor A